MAAVGEEPPPPPLIADVSMTQTPAVSSYVPEEL